MNLDNGFLQKTANGDTGHGIDSNIEKREGPAGIGVWLLDDTQDYLDLFQDMSDGAEGVDIKVFNRSAPMLQCMLEGDRPDILLMDGKIEGEDVTGEQLVQKIRKEYDPERQVVLFAFTNSPVIEKEMLKNGADYALKKDSLGDFCEILADRQKLEEVITNRKIK